MTSKAGTLKNNTYLQGMHNLAEQEHRSSSSKVWGILLVKSCVKVPGVDDPFAMSFNC